MKHQTFNLRKKEHYLRPLLDSLVGLVYDGGTYGEDEMRYEDSEYYNYDYDELVENADELYEPNDEPWMDSYEDEEHNLREYDSYYHNVADEIVED